MREIQSYTRRCALMAPWLVLVAATFALAHEGAKGVVKERMDLMKGQQKDMKLIGDMTKGKVKFDATKAAAAARNLAETTKKIPDLFPEGSGGHPSEALDTVWKDWESFTGNAKDAEAAANELAATLDGGTGDWKAGFKKLTEACKSCHQDFRSEEKEGH